MPTQENKKRLKKEVNPIVEEFPEEEMDAVVSESTEEIPATSEERRVDLENKYDDFKEKERNSNTKVMMAKNQFSEVKGSMIKALLQILEDEGVDLSDLGSIRDFLEKLSKKDPDLVAIFEIAFNSLAGEEGMADVSDEEVEGTEGLFPAGEEPGELTDEEIGLSAGQTAAPINRGAPQPMPGPMPMPGPFAPAGPVGPAGPLEPIDDVRRVPFQPPQA